MFVLMVVVADCCPRVGCYCRSVVVVKMTIDMMDHLE
jgi:hypothetical protein